MYTEIETRIAPLGLTILGALHPARQPVKALTGGTLLMLGTQGSFWAHFRTSPEALDGQPDPVDRWSHRVISDLADAVSATPYFPFGGPPYTPFVNWALATGRVFSTPAGPMVHDTMGMMISFRGALHFEAEFALPPPPLPQSPCESCADKPCLTTCPVTAFDGSGTYDLEACHGYLDTPAGQTCMTTGCLARLACPLSSNSSRDPTQTSHHMRYFHPR